MRHCKKGRKLNRSLGHRKALYRNLVSSLVKHEKIETTLAKAKAIKGKVERLVTVARKGDLPARRRLLKVFYAKELVEKMLKEIGPRFKSRSGGYTRIVKLGPRSSDKAEMARLEFLPEEKKDRDRKKKAGKGSKGKG